MSKERPKTILPDFLELLGVRHTTAYSDSRLQSMPFKTLFGLQQLLRDYGVESEAWALSDKTEITALVTPFIAPTSAGMVIVTAATSDSVSYMTDGVVEKMPTADFLKAWTGVAFTAQRSSSSCEPGYRLHSREEFFARSKKWVLVASLALLFVYLFVSNGIYRHVSTVLIVLFDMFGLALSYMLVQKSLNVHSAAADRVCGVLQQSGCDDVMRTDASKFFGLFGWSEVGFAYFSVSLLTLLIFPQWTPYLALCNVCCLPYSFWSIWYQKYRAKAWCTLCCSVQLTLWLLFFCYLGGGFFRDFFPLRIELVVLGLSYLAALLSLNALMPAFDRNPKDTDNGK